jgi:hypothetical protein
MKKLPYRSIALSLFVLVFAAAFGVFAQTPAGGVKPSVVAGDVVSADKAKLVLLSKDGTLDAIFSPTTEFKRVPADNPKLSAAVAADLSDIGPGDKVAVSGILSDDKKSIAVRTVYLMSKTDIAARETAERQKWTTRGISGRVSAVDQLTKQVKIEVRGLAGSTTVVLSPKDNAKFLRYAPNSVKFSEAVSSTIVEVQPGDMLRAVGDRSPDGASFAAEEVITGAFRTLAGTVKSIDAAKNEVLITDASTKKDVTIELGTAILIKKFPEEMAQRMAQFGGGAPPAGAGSAPARPVQGPPAGGGAGPGGQPGGPGRGMGGPRGGIDDMLDRFPTITIAELKAGDVIAVSSSRDQAAVDRIKAIKLLAGVEPFLRAAQAQAAAAGQRGSQGVSLSIPGLDGFGNP